MGNRRTYASVTDIPCTCGYLEKAADDPENPIVFDERTSEYQFIYQRSGEEGRSMSVIYHCPFCGGAAPESQRDRLFAAISDTEMDRIALLVGPIETIQQAIDKLGPPQMDSYGVIRNVRRDDPNNPPTIQRCRELLYTTLSEVADVRITEAPGNRVSFTLSGKYIGG
jgi:hypothetical protein